MNRRRFLLPIALFALSLPGCHTAPEPPEPVEQEQTGADVPAEQSSNLENHDEQLATARRRLEAADKQVTAVRAAITRYLENNPLDSDEDARRRETALQVQRLVIEKQELGKALDRLQATHSQLKEEERQNSYTPAADELAMIEAGLGDYDKQLKELREALEKPENPEIQAAIGKQIEEVEAERNKEIAKQTKLLLDAKLEQARLGVQILSEELKKVSESLDEWTAKRQETVRLLDEYETLARELEAAEQERDRAVKAIEDLLETSGR